jgi:aminopeptidase N
MRKLAFFAAICILLFLQSCSTGQDKINEPGVSKELAEVREKQLSDITYSVFFDIPDSLNEEIKGKVTIKFMFSTSENEPLIIDFQNTKEKILAVKINQQSGKYKFENQHIIIPRRKLKEGNNTIEIDFISTDRALNRNKEYLFTLFVPDRASTAFPCFDQPSLKATYALELKTPVTWTAVANAKQISKQQVNDYNLFSFSESEPISTYLFSFAAGVFKAVSTTHNNRTITMYHRESDSLKVLRNQQKIFDLHFSSLEWLENYTNIPYPFQKFDFVIIPSFQYSGMEHPGAILYRDSKLFLDESASIRDELSRANLIAHETAHIWFGDLVTMKWFSQVWLKEVFANFIADKIVNPQFPDVNHNLNFLISHYPESYSVDRTNGANPIDQTLDNMKNAGTLYGSIIYHKAPIAMLHLENIVGDSLLKIGLQDYLVKYFYGNAGWDNLIEILALNTDFDIKSWSNEWMKTPGMPTIKINKAYNSDDKLASIILEQTDPMGKGRNWSQFIDLLIHRNGKTDNRTVFVNGNFTDIPLNTADVHPDLVLANSTGFGYGYFELDDISKNYLLKNLSDINNPLYRCNIYITLWENMLNQNISPSELLNTFINSIKTETEEQNISLVLNYISTLYWKFINSQKREIFSADLENLLWSRVNETKSGKLKYTYLKSYINISNTSKSLENLYKIWNKELQLSGISLSENDYTDLSYEIALRSGINGDSILSAQLSRISDTERKEKMQYIIPALSNNIEVRDHFYESLKLEKNREKEVWVTAALYYLNHPFRSSESIKYIRPSLDLLKEIQITGDIFFPKQWLDGTFSGHSSIDAVIEVNLFLNENPDYPENLKNKIIQSSDLLLRASQVIDK